MKQIMQQAHSVTLVYKNPQRNFVTEDIHTHCACVELLCNYSIHCSQSSTDTLIFESAQDAFRAYFYLSGNSLYTPCLRETTDS
jgi:hypothetical protein